MGLPGQRLGASGLDGLVRLGHTIAARTRQEGGANGQAHLEGILTAVVTGASNARAEGFNTMIQKIKRDARGFRNKERFKAAIYFHLGGLDLYPEAVRK